MTKVIGLTGNIGTGKSTVAKMFNELGAQIIDADRVARDIVEPNKPAWTEIVNYFGEKILNKDRTINRKKLGEIVFKDEEKRLKLNNITHPKIMKKIRSFVNECKKKNASAVIIEAALIVEKGGLKDLIDALIVVSSNEERQLQRIKTRDKIDLGEARSRIKSQLPISEKIKYADFIINNSTNLEETRKQVNKIWRNLTNP